MCNTNGYSAIAYPDEGRIEIGKRRFGRWILWHECGHLLTPWTDEWCAESETEAQLMAILLALNRGYINVAKELIYGMEEWKKHEGCPAYGHYALSRKRLKRRLKNYL